MQIKRWLKDRVPKKVSEILDPVPMASPVALRPPETLQQKIQRLVRSEQLAMYAESQGVETFEESEDFDVYDPIDGGERLESPYELSYDPELKREITQEQRVIRAEEARAANAAIDALIKQKKAQKKAAEKAKKNEAADAADNEKT